MAAYKHKPFRNICRGTKGKLRGGEGKRLSDNSEKEQVEQRDASRWNSIGEVIEKLSCRSRWFVGPVHALIHPAAPPHKQNIKQATPEERKRERCGRESGREQRHEEKGWERKEEL
ncbi:hypothetical protein Q8A73_004774 [Channa argus]|nr:hypothetical protein Q8A73_004774 [Channa argus]